MRKERQQLWLSTAFKLCIVRTTRGTLGTILAHSSSKGNGWEKKRLCVCRRVCRQVRSVCVGASIVSMVTCVDGVCRHVCVCVCIAVCVGICLGVCLGACVTGGRQY